MTTATDPREASRPRNYFATTHWSVVLKAGRSDTTRADEALSKLCQTYWYPLYAYVRRRGYSPHDAQDLTQGFFECLLARKSLASADPHKGRFRSFMLGAMSHFLTDQWEKSQTQKRGGGQELISLDLAAAEERFDLEPVDTATPDKAFDREWATALLDEVLAALEKEYQREGKGELFEALKTALAGTRECQPYALLGKRLELTEGAARVAVHRMRKRYRELLRAEIANTVTSPDELGEEMNYLFQAMAGGE